MDVSDYKPAAHVLDRLKQVDFVAVIGPTAVGKSTLIKAAIKQSSQLHLVLVNTTRKPRPEEKEGVDYWFRDHAAMKARIAKGEYAQIAPSVLGELYATAPEDYSAKGVSIMAVIADAIPAFRSLPFKSFRSVFVVPPSWEAWLQRMAVHHFTPEQLTKRLAEAQESLGFALEDGTTRLLINQDLATATDDLVALATGQQPSERLKQDQIVARMLVRNLLNELNARALFS